MNSVRDASHTNEMKNEKLKPKKKKNENQNEFSFPVLIELYVNAHARKSCGWYTSDNFVEKSEIDFYFHNASMLYYGNEYEVHRAHISIHFQCSIF